MDVWRVTTGSGDGLPFGPGGVSVAELLDDGTIVAWGPSARELLGYRPDETVGQGAGPLLAEGGAPAGPISHWCSDGDTGELALRHRAGHTVRVRARLSELRDARGELRWMITALPYATAVRRDVDRALLTGVAERTSMGLAVLDTELRYVWINPALERITGVPAQPRYGRRFHEMLPSGAEHIVEAAERVLRTGEPANDMEYQGPVVASPDRPVALSVSCFRIEDSAGRVAGVGYALLDVTQRFRARERLQLLNEAGARLGNTLDPGRVAREAVDIAVPRMAAGAAVDLLESVTEPEAVGRLGDGAAGPVRTVARSAADEGDGRRLLVPLRAGGRPLGLLRLRARVAEPFEPDDVTAAQELAQRLATCVDNASRFERERTAALALRRALLPRDVPHTGALDVAARHLPAADGQAGGAWYDVIPLSGARIALVTGRVVGRGLAAAASMGRLRTAVRTLARLDLPPGELLAHLDDIVAALREESPREGVDPGGSCLYAVYDPVERRLSVASAGHLAPLLALPPGTSAPAAAVGPPLGDGAGLPFETTEVPLPEGSLLALCGAAPADWAAALERARVSGATVYRACGELAAGLRSVAPGQEQAVLTARALGVPADRVAVWDVPAEASAVARVRAQAAGRMAAWGLGEQAFPTELVVSELVTNAIRYGRPPVRLRLIRGESLTCEVFDGSDTTPHVRRAAPDEEGGRGLFLVARLTERWGTRYTSDGKTVWSEQPLPPP